MTREQTLVVGAGPAGLAAAITLARAGRAVFVRERRAAPGQRHHGFQGLENWSATHAAPRRLQALGIDPACLLRPVHAVSYYGPARREHIVHAPEPLCYLVRRGDRADALDRRLAAEAESLGVTIHYNDPVAAAPPGTIVGIGPTAAMAVAKGMTFRTDAPDMALCIVDPEIAPKAYAYLLTHDGEGTLAVMLTEDFHATDSYFDRAVRAFRDLRQFSVEDPAEFGGAGGVDFAGRLLVGGHLRVGECAGAQDALWGFGMWFAMESGVLAARSLLGGFDYPAAFRRRLLPRMRRLLVCRWLFERIPAARYEREIASFSRLPDARRRLHRLYGRSALLELLYPLAIRRFTRQLQENRCHMAQCPCVWCRHGRDELLVPECHPATS